MAHEPVRVFLSVPRLAVGARADLSPDESHYLRHVLRGRVGDAVTILDTASNRPWRARILAVASTVSVEIEADATLRSDGIRSRVELLCLARSKGAVEEEVVTKAVELGVERLILWEGERSVRKGRENQRERLERIVVAAARQSGKAWLQQLDFCESADELIKKLQRPDFASMTRLLCSLDSAAPAVNTLSTPSSVGIVIGPEGDISPAERQLFEAARFIPVTLGPFTLRVATAAAAAITAVDTVFGLRHLTN